MLIHHLIQRFDVCYIKLSDLTVSFQQKFIGLIVKVDVAQFLEKQIERYFPKIREIMKENCFILMLCGKL